MPKCPWERAFSKATGHFPGGSTIFDAQDLKAKFGRNNWRRILTNSPCHNFHRSSKCQKCPWNGFFKGQRLFQRPTANGHSPVSSTIFAATTFFFVRRHFFLYVEEEKIEDLNRSVWNWKVVAMSRYVCSGCSELRPPCFVSSASTWNPANDYRECGPDSRDGGLSKGLIRSDCLVPWSVPMSVRLFLSA